MKVKPRYKLMYKYNEVTKVNDIVKVYMNDQGEFIHYEVAAKG